MSALNGFETSIFSAYKKTDPDLLVLPQKGVVVSLPNQGKSANKTNPLVRLQKLKGVAVVSRVFVGKAVLKYGDQQTVCLVWGVDEQFKKRILLDSLASAGEPRFVDERTMANPNLISDMAVLSEGLVYKLGVGKIEQPITLMVINKDAGVHDLDAFGMEEFIPSAIVSLAEDQNTQTVIIGLSQAQRIFGAGSSEMTQVEIRLDASVRTQPSAVESIKEQVKTIMNEAGAGTFVVKNQHEQHPLMYKMFNTEKWISFVLGLVFGVGLVLLQMNTNLVSTQGTFSIPYPVELRVGDLFLILLLNTFLGILSAVFPAWRAGKMSGDRIAGTR